jgi:putative DNA primase/helicase
MNLHVKPPSRDFREEVTNDIVKLLEQGTSPWQRPWEAGELGGIPFNPTTMKPYRGGNILSLMIASMVHGYTDPRWITFNQAKNAGWHVRKGEHHSARCQYVEMKRDKTSTEDDPQYHPVFNTFQLFNAQQIDGMPPLHVEPRKPFEIVESAEQILKASGAEIRHGGAKAYYSPRGDYIQMPPRDCFVDEAHYYATALHELAHWTGARNRLDRTAEKGAFGSPEYAKEEIRADIASLFLAAELGIPYDPKEQAGYIGHWIQVLKNDKSEVFKAASDASKICDYILGKERAIESPQSVEGPYAAAVTVARSNESRSL